MTSPPLPPPPPSPHDLFLPPADRQLILRYLRGCKFSLERTKAKLDMYYTCKGALPDMFKGRDPQNPKLRSIIKLG